MRDQQGYSSRLQELEARFWTGPVAHLVGGALDVVTALGRHLAARSAHALRARLRRARRDG